MHTQNRLQNFSEETWSRVREAVAHQYPDIDASELHSLHALDRNTEQLITFVRDRTQADRDEIESVIDAAIDGRSAVTRAAAAGAQRIQTAFQPVGDNVRQGWSQLNDQIEAHPLSTGGIAFVTGLTLGVLVTLALMPERQPQSNWQRFQSRSWF